MARTISVVLSLVVATGAAAQESPSFRITDHAFNEGGHPAAGAVPASTSYRVTLDAVGDTVVARDLTSASYRANVSLTQSYPPPGEVTGMLFVDVQTLTWNPEPSVGAYNLYRDLISELSDLGYGVCTAEEIAGPTTTDGDPVPAGDGFFYLVTAENLLDEEGSKGQDSSQTQRTGDMCP